jgi:phospholipase C
VPIRRRHAIPSRFPAASGLVLGLSLSACGGSAATLGNADAGADATNADARPDAPVLPADASLASRKIQHVIVIMQENRSFDHYFGTFPGAEGIPMDANGVPTVCAPDPKAGGACVKPYRLLTDKNVGGPHGSTNATADINGGKMDGFIAQAEQGKTGCGDPNDPACTNGTTIDVMGYHTDAEIPNYWAYAKSFVLQDHMFQPNASWSFPQHIMMVSAFSATCTAKADPMTCSVDIDNPGGPGNAGPAKEYPWTDITYLLHKAGVSWKYYLGEGDDPHCGGDPSECEPIAMLPTVPNIWNPLPQFDTVKEDGELGNIVAYDEFYADVKGGTLPAVSWLVPASEVSEHPTALVSAGQAHVTALINTVMQSPYWDSTAIFLSWDDWGGFYDHVPPPKVDAAGYGLRVPGLVISAYAKQGYVDKQVLSHDAYLKFIEDVFLGGARLDPKTDGRPDSRPDVRENAATLGDLMNDFDFTQAPRAPMVLPVK